MSPFVSKKQARYAFATKQPWAKEWADKTDFKKLPESVSKKKCMKFPTPIAKKKCMKFPTLKKSDGGGFGGAGTGLTTTGTGVGVIPAYGMGSYPKTRKKRKVR